MPQNTNVRWVNSNVDGWWPRCLVANCPDQFMDEADRDVRRHFDRQHPGVTPAES